MSVRDPAPRPVPVDPGRPPVAADVSIGHVHLKVADIGRAVRFYRDVLGFDVMQQWGEAAFLSAGGYHHHIGLNTWESRGGQPPPAGATGLYHVAIRYGSRAGLARAFARLLEHGVGLDGASDHGVSQALYLHDPDGNGIELYWDRPRAEWPVEPETGRLAMVSERLDLAALLAGAGRAREGPVVPGSDDG